MASYKPVAQKVAAQVFSNPRDQALFLRQMQQEAGFGDPTSPAGAQGPAQIMPATAKGWGVKNVHDPNEAYTAAAQHMKQYLQSYGGDWAKALTAYNAGPGRVGGPLPSETQKYIKTILGGATGAKSTTPAAQGLSTPAQSTTLQPAFDAAGYKQAQTRALLGQMIAKHRGTSSSLFTSGLLSTQAPSPADFQTMQKVGVPTSQVAAPGTSTAKVAQAIERANVISAKKMPYLWGGGHQAKVTDVSKTNPLDCSGAVSAVLGIDPRVASQFKTFGSPGDGGSKGITVYAKDDHVLMKINGHFFGTSHANPGGGAGWIPQSAIPPSYLRAFTARHLAGG